MGKNKNKENKSNKKFNDNKDDEASDLERLKAYAEKTGRNIWEVTLLDLEEHEDDNDEVEELEFNDETEKEEQNLAQNDNTNESNKNLNPELKQESLDNLINDEIIPIISENIDNNPDLFEHKIHLQLEKLEINSTTEKEEEYPLYVKINNEITKIIHLESEKYHIVENTKNGVLNVKFGNTKVIFEYPKEDINPQSNQNKKLKKKVSESETVVFEKKDKKKKNCDQQDEIGPEDLIRLEEAKRKREEFAFLEKCRIEEEEILKQENAQKLLEETKKQKEKNKYKPKPKKKKGK